MPNSQKDNNQLQRSQIPRFPVARSRILCSETFGGNVWLRLSGKSAPVAFLNSHIWLFSGKRGYFGYFCGKKRREHDVIVYIEGRESAIYRSGEISHDRGGYRRVGVSWEELGHFRSRHLTGVHGRWAECGSSERLKREYIPAFLLLPPEARGNGLPDNDSISFRSMLAERRKNRSYLNVILRGKLFASFYFSKASALIAYRSPDTSALSSVRSECADRITRARMFLCRQSFCCFKIEPSVK